MWEIQPRHFFNKQREFNPTTKEIPVSAVIILDLKLRFQKMDGMANHLMKT